MPNYDDELRFADMMADRAEEIMKGGLGSAATTKGDGTPVTRMDREINEMLAAAVAARGEQALGEEDVRHVGPSDGRVWVCDPIDGSWLYAAGLPGAVFSLALVENGRPVLGVIRDPWTGRHIHAVRGQGAYVNGRPTGVNRASQIRGACLALPGSPMSSLDVTRLFSQAAALGVDVVTSGSAIQDAMAVPLGLAAGAVYPYTSPWDMAAIAVIATEAGGRITDLDGADQRYDQPINGAVISNGLTHQQLVAMVAAAR